MTQIRGLDAVVLIVKDLEKQKAFYQEVLGLELEADYGDALFFKLGDQKLALFARSHHPQGTQRLEGAPKGLSHLEFRVSAKDRERLEQRLRDQGFHAYTDNFEDADGNLFHFNSEK
ncbi:MAG: glyoxalase/bleomycin resistance/dioxygenase family protein [Nitrospinaceae bacterium]|nr:VOC family protein [Nitrospinaceae bacterium]NIR53841.1 VOC family protein [Nitrospinaceae bacterium]NIS84252.1 VOC family protein [Nitrospinaceae bacterium]NIT81056.1 VOC family protein [Nitrospinaceae bacterium]NIU43347.1 VOC family protein [Nitrospinaceae bacterium]